MCQPEDCPLNAVRKPAIAGSFYPGEANVLAREVDELLATAATDAPAPKACIVPHAGHVYSGQLAAMVYARLRNATTPITRVVLLGPSHQIAFRGIATSNAPAFQTPLGEVPVDHAAIKEIERLEGVGAREAAHATEHSVEVHLPFLQRCLKNFQLVPLVVGDATPGQVADVLEVLWGGPETLVVVSSDLSHFHDYDTARTQDARTSQRITGLATDISGEEACGCRPINGLTTFARRRGIGLSEVDTCNSGDTAGDRVRVVGYGAYVMTDDQAGSLGTAEKQQLLYVARGAIHHKLTSRDDYNINLDHFPDVFKVDGAAFVTLNLGGTLRGCIGSLSAHRALAADVAHNAQAAAFNDSRFKPLTLAELRSVEIHVSVLSPPAPISVDGHSALLRELRPGIDGLIFEERGMRATYLPSVWEQLPDADTFVSQLRQKAGLPASGWDESTRVYRYTTDEFA
jgi:AmmeMemoRadiSam system protein B/AmmeMemoRadiSam system protein A